MDRVHRVRRSAWAFIPARGGSKGIPLKNIALLGGRPLLDYASRAALASGCFERIVCSTDHPTIAQRARELGLEVDVRPAELASDTATTQAAILEWLARQGGWELPEFIFVVEPTSPFLRPADIRLLLERFDADIDAVSAQTVALPPHTHHAWNQRRLEGGYVRFAFAERKAVNFKQEKPILYIFGNLLACRTACLLAGQGLFDEPSVGVEIERPYDVNIDYPDDMNLAEALLRTGMVDLPHMSSVTDLD